MGNRARPLGTPIADASAKRVLDDFRAANSKMGDDAFGGCVPKVFASDRSEHHAQTGAAACAWDSVADVT